jgi:hypothetical protein
MNQPVGTWIPGLEAHHGGVSQTPNDPAQHPPTPPEANPVDPATQPIAPAATAQEPPVPPAPQPPVPPHGTLSPREGGLHGWWHRATATPGRRLATGLAAALAILGLLGVLALGALAVGTVAFGRGGHGAERADSWSRTDGGKGDRMGRQGDGRGQGKGWQNNEQNQPFDPNGGGSGQGPRGRMDGMGPMGGMGALAGALHGEVTVATGGTPSVLLFQTGQVTAVDKASLAVKSSDGFTATYALSSSTIVMPSQPVVGSTVRVLANKEGAAATRVMVLSAGAGTTS